VALPTPLAPGASARVALTIAAPVVPGPHGLEFDVVLEGVAWFATCGSQSAHIAVQVGEADGARSPDMDVRPGAPWRVHEAQQPSLLAGEAEQEPVMEMHAVPRDQVEALLLDAGARLLGVRRVHHCGPLWLAFRYDVTK